ncbi:hypothetical protein [Streptomyces mirabilis]|uniref:hypothetical protein n=1 Tax=Streptomyces mirabilis TaxID=68239 RepID=UPI0036D82476
MRIRMLVQMPPDSLRNGQPWPAEGETEDIPTGEALHLVASGVAEEAERAVRRSKSKREGA